ncbi:MAG: response regulator [Nitrospirae bacterium]|nr:MAG: response regulator [Nitrospirota bacterium]
MEDRIMIVDDEPRVISALKRALLDEPYEVISANSGTEGLKVLEDTPVKVIISDERMPGMSGAEFLSIVRKRHPFILRIMLTGHASLDAAMKAVNDGEIYRFFTKPWNDLELKLAIRSAIERFDIEEENRRLLRIVKRQASELKLIEKMYPEITKLERDEKGNLIVEDISDEEFQEVLAECVERFR